MRLLKNKLLMFNIISGIFYILGSSGYITFLSKYIEVQFHKNTANATVITGPITLFGMVAGFLISGIVISKKKPSPKILLFWNVVVGVGYMLGQFSYLFLTCPDGTMPLVEGRLNLSTACNSQCHCDGVPYSPICQEETGITFFSACHAGCDAWDAKGKYYDQCTCQNENYSPITKPWEMNPSFTTRTMSRETTLPDIIPTTAASTSTSWSPSSSTTNSISTFTVAAPDEYDDTHQGKSVPLLRNSSDTYKTSPPGDTDLDDIYLYDNEDDLTYDEKDFNATSSKETEQDLANRTRREVNEMEFTSTTPSGTDSPFTARLIPGACLKGCAMGFYLFSIISSIINCFGASGRIGNLLVNYR